MNTVAVIGAGASGMMAAVSAASEGAHVSLFEKNDSAGRKLLLTGNGKCNLSSASFSLEHYRGSIKESGIAENVFNTLSVEDTLKLFSSFGLLIREKNGGFYPRSDSSVSVLDVLLKELDEKDVELYFFRALKRICVNENGGFELFFNDLKSGRILDSPLHFDRVIIASGGKASPKTGSTGDGYFWANELGLGLSDPLPGLSRLYSGDAFFKELSGVRVTAALELIVDGVPSGTSGGELQLTDKGPSGICAFDLSGRAKKALTLGKKCILKVDFLPEYSVEETALILKGRAFSGYDFFTGIFPDRLSHALFKLLNGMLSSDALNPHVGAALNDAALEKAARIIKGVSFNISDTGDFSSAQITTGGILAGSVDHDLKARNINGLYFAGEILDIDGDCGGYNLQWAWSSGYTAGKAAALS